MDRFACKSYICVAWGVLCLLLPQAVPAQAINSGIVSEHVRMAVPMEREWLGRDVVMDLERCWRFVNSTTNKGLPRRILVEVAFDNPAVRAYPEGRIVVGMRTPAAEFDMRGFLLRSAAREIARLGLIGLARGEAVRADSELLLEGMSEIIAREFFHTTRRLGGAWVHAQLIDRMQPLSLAALSASSAPGEGHDLRMQAPAITFLLTCNENLGRERTMKMLEALRRGTSLEESIALTSRTTATALEAAWLKNVRSYAIADSLQALQDEETPKLERVACAPVTIAGGQKMQLRLYIKKGANALLPQSIYLMEDSAGRYSQARLLTENGTQIPLLDAPMEPGKSADACTYRVLAIDEGGSVSEWQGTCSPAR